MSQGTELEEISKQIPIVSRCFTILFMVEACNNRFTLPFFTTIFLKMRTLMLTKVQHIYLGNRFFCFDFIRFFCLPRTTLFMRTENISFNVYNSSDNTFPPLFIGRYIVYRAIGKAQLQKRSYFDLKNLQECLRG